jgi:uncharacterized FlaG/YvyC family protein
MISISKKTVSTITKIGLFVFVIYIIGYVFFKTASYYKIYYEKEQLTKELQMKKNETNSLKRQLENTKKRIENTQKQYISKEELDTKIKDIFKRMSILDYNLKFIDSKKMCVDRYVLITQVTAESDKGLIAGEGILSYIGEVKKSDKNPSIYFVDYVTKAKEVK